MSKVSCDQLTKKINYQKHAAGFVWVPKSLPKPSVPLSQQPNVNLSGVQSVGAASDSNQPINNGSNGIANSSVQHVGGHGSNQLHGPNPGGNSANSNLGASGRNVQRNQPRRRGAPVSSRNNGIQPRRNGGRRPNGVGQPRLGPGRGNVRSGRVGSSVRVGHNQPLARARNLLGALKTFVDKLSPKRSKMRYAELEGERISIPMMLDYDQAKEFHKIFGLAPVCTTGDVHDHPLSAAVRWMVQRYVESHIVNRCKEKNKPVKYVDIYGSSRLPNMFKWSVMPELTPNDIMRRRPTRSCKCDIYSCPHLDASTSFSVDSLYYMNVEDIAHICSNNLLKEHHVAFHRMLQHSGVVNKGEYRWTTFENDGKLYNKVYVGGETTGNMYTNPRMDWLDQRVWKTSKGYLYYVFRKNYGPMEYGVFFLDDKELQVQPYENEDRYVQIISWKLDTPEKDVHWINKLVDMAKFTIGQFVGLKHRYKLVEYQVPFDLYTKLIQQAMFTKMEDRENLCHELKGRALRWKNECNQKNQYVDEMQFTNYLPHVIAAAMTVSLPSEFGSMHYSYINDFCVTNPELWRKNYSRPKRIVLSLGVVLASTIALFCTKPLIPVIGLVAGLLAIAAKYKTNVSGYDSVRRYDYATSTCQGLDMDNYYKFVTSLDTVKKDVKLPCIPGFTDYITKDKNVFTIKKPDVRQMTWECNCDLKEVRKPSVAKIIKFEGVDVMSYTNCVCNMFSAMSQRYFRPTPKQDPNFWKTEYQALLHEGSEFLDTDLNVAGNYSEWYKGLETHKKKLVDRAILKNDVTRIKECKCRVKQEVTLKLSEVDKPGKPRGYFPSDQLHYAETGPSMYSYKKMLCRNMNGRRTKFIFACGMNPLELGKTLEDALSAHLPNTAQIVADEGDLKTCESTQTGYLLALQSKNMENAGVTPHVLDLLFTQESSNCKFDSNSMGEMVISMKNCLFSGRSNTSVGNTSTFATVMKRALAKYGVIDYVVMIGGDDSVLYYYIHDYAKVQQVWAYVLMSGLEPEVIHRRDYRQARFYSGVFLPCLDNKGHRHLTHAPLLSKAFIKSFTYRLKPGLDVNQWLEITMDQKRRVWSHIPILNSVHHIGNKFLNGQEFKSMKGKSVAYMDVGGFLHRDLISQPPLKPADDIYDYLEAIYGVTPDEMMRLESVLMAHDFVNEPNFSNETFKILLRFDMK